MAKPDPVLNVRSLDELRAANRALYARGYSVPSWLGPEGLNKRLSDMWENGATRVGKISIKKHDIIYHYAGDTPRDCTLVNSVSHMVAYLRRSVPLETEYDPF